jgi:O-antigen ligase
VLFVLVFYLVRRFLQPQRTARARAENLALLLGALLLGASLLVMRNAADVTSGRLELWGIALSEFLQQVQAGQYFGTGMGMAADYLYGLYGMPIAVDNSYLLPLLEIGLPGFCLWLAALLACWGMAVRESGDADCAPACRCLWACFAILFSKAFCSLSVDSLSWLVYLFCAG